MFILCLIFSDRSSHMLRGKKNRKLAKNDVISMDIDNVYCEYSQRDVFGGVFIYLLNFNDEKKQQQQPVKRDIMVLAII